MSEAYDYSKVHLLVATPCYGGQLYNGYFESILRLQKVFAEKGAQLTIKTISNESLITRARNFYCSLILADDTYTHLMFIDSDIVFNPYSILRMLEFDKEVVAGAYPKKYVHWDRVPQLSNIAPEMIQPKLYDYAMAWKAVGNAGENLTINMTNGFARIEYAATGFLLIKKQVLHKIVENMPYLKYRNDMKGYESSNNAEWFYSIFDCVIHPITKQYLSEDYAFCKRWLELDGEIWLDVLCDLTHIGTHPFAGNTRSMFNEFTVKK